MLVRGAGGSICRARKYGECSYVRGQYLDLINHPSEALYRNFEPWHSRFTAFVRRHLGSEPVAHTNLGKGFGRPPSPCGSVARYRAHLRVRNSTGAIARTYNNNPSQTYLLRSRFKALGRQIVDMLSSVTNLLHLECRSERMTMHSHSHLWGMSTA